MLSGLRVLEIGCQEGFGTYFIAPYVEHVTSIDFFPPFLAGFRKYTLPNLSNCDIALADICDKPIPGDFDGAFALDVLEHIDVGQEHLFWRNIASSVKSHGIVIVGMPSLESQKYASEASKIGHVNCKSGMDLRASAERYFRNVFIFSMNDEMLHNGFLPMSHYLFAICIDPNEGIL
jgi:SAM-dependent methyltransferase